VQYESMNPNAGALAVPVNRVLRNTYLMLTLMLLVSAGGAAYAMSSGMRMPNFWLMLGFVILMPMAIAAFRNSAIGLVLSFAYAGLLGLFVGPLISHYAQIDQRIPLFAFIGAATMFGALSTYAMTTKRDFSVLRGFLVASVFAVLAAIVAQYFLNLPLFGVVLSVAILALSSLWILYYTQAMVRGGETNYVIVANGLFASVWNLFLNLMQLLGFASGD
jgi:modulator of FtsH protease